MAQCPDVAQHLSWYAAGPGPNANGGTWNREQQPSAEALLRAGESNPEPQDV